MLYASVWGLRWKRHEIQQFQLFLIVSSRPVVVHSEFKASSVLPEILPQSSFLSLKLMKIVWFLLAVHYSLSTFLHTLDCSSSKPPESQFPLIRSRVNTFRKTTQLRCRTSSFWTLLLITVFCCLSCKVLTDSLILK